MRCRVIRILIMTVIAMVCSTRPVAGQPSAGQAPGNPSSLPTVSAHLDPETGHIDGVAPGKVLGQRTERGLKVISNIAGNRYAIEIPGQDFKPQHPERLVWSVDHKVIQILSVPLNPEVDMGNPQEVLLAHQKYENDHVGQGGWSEIEAARQWLDFPGGEPALFWEMGHPDPPGDPATRIVKQLFATTLNGRNVIVLNAPVGVTMDEADCKTLIRETMLSLHRFEPPADNSINAQPQATDEITVYPANAQAVLINADMATPRDHNEPTSIVIDRNVLMLVVRLGLELDKSPQFMTELSDGQSAHMVNLKGFDRASKRILYWEPRGEGSFLSEDNNIAGVKAQPHPEERKFFYVTLPEMEKVLRAVITEAQYVRLASHTGSLEGAFKEYDAVHKQWPQGEETSEPRLLQAAGLLIEMEEMAKAFNVLAVCSQLHESSSRALAGIADIYSRIGESQPAANFYRDAIARLANDNSLSDAQKQEHQRLWSAAMEKLPVR